MKAFLHIGTEKTGTTTIQNFLAQNRSVLAEDGFLYPTSPGKKHHIRLVAYAAQIDCPEDVRDRLYGLDYAKILDPHNIAGSKAAFRDALATELKSTRAHTVVFSSEHCSSRLTSQDEIFALRQLLEPFFTELAVIIYLRRQDDLLVSSYSTQVICDGRTAPIGLPPAEIINTYYDYQQILQKWEAVFGKSQIVVRPFERQQLHQADLVADFAKVVGFPLDQRYIPVPRMNESYGVESLECLRLMNQYVPRYVGDRINPHRQRLFQLLKVYPSQNYALADSEFRANFLSQFSESNAFVAKHYLGRNSGELFTDSKTDQDAPTFPGFTAERAAEVFAYLWQQQSEELQALRQSQRIQPAQRPSSALVRAFRKLKRIFFNAK